MKSLLKPYEFMRMNYLMFSGYKNAIIDKCRNIHNVYGFGTIPDLIEKNKNTLQDVSQKFENNLDWLNFIRQILKVIKAVDTLLEAYKVANITEIVFPEQQPFFEKYTLHRQKFLDFLATDSDLKSILNEYIEPDYDNDAMGYFPTLQMGIENQENWVKVLGLC